MGPISVTLPLGAVTTTMLAGVRIAAFLFLAPPFSHKAVPGQVKALLAVGLSARDLVRPYRVAADLSAREFARRFWVEQGRDAELACLKSDLGVEFDVENLLRMDGSTQADYITKLVGGGVMTPNEARANFGLKPIDGGNTVYMQQQDIPMSVAAAQTQHPNAVREQEPPPSANDDEAAGDDLTDDDAKSLAAWRIEKAVGALMEAGR